jgi:hypothetical protein
MHMPEWLCLCKAGLWRWFPNTRTPTAAFAQLTSTPGNSGNPTYSAAAWIAPKRDAADPTAWVDASGPVTSAPWCPGEPNDHSGSEDCTSLLTNCGAPGAAVNDYSCDWLLRVVCQVPSSSACGEWGSSLAP